MPAQYFFRAWAGTELLLLLCRAVHGVVSCLILQVDQGHAKEGLISVGSTRSEEPDPLDPEIIQRLDNKFQYRDMADGYYSDEDGDEVTHSRLSLTNCSRFVELNAPHELQCRDWSRFSPRARALKSHQYGELGEKVGKWSCRPPLSLTPS